MLAGFRTRADLDGVGRGVGGLDGYHGGGTGGQRSTGHDPVCGTGFERERIGAACGDVLGDGQQHGLLGGRGGDVVGDDGVPVHRRIVEARQRQRRHHVLGKHQAQRVGDGDGDRRLAGDQIGDDATMLLDGPHQTG